VPGLGKAGYPRAMSDKPAPVRPARWWEKVVCSTQGHNLPEGFSWQICRTCAQPVKGFTSPRPREPLSPVRATVGFLIAVAVLEAVAAAGSALLGWLDLTGFLVVIGFAAVSLTLGLVLRRLTNRRPRRT
jgi:hypothetical protein